MLCRLEESAMKLWNILTGWQQIKRTHRKSIWDRPRLSVGPKKKYSREREKTRRRRQIEKGMLKYAS